MKLELQVRDLQTGVAAPKTFESVADAKAWLQARPKFTEVLGIASHHVSSDVSQECRACLRPLDDDEHALVRKLNEAVEAEASARAAYRAKKEEEAAAKHRDEMATADPNRPMEVRYTFRGDISPGDGTDPRIVTDEARAAVREWIDERNDWVKSRGQVVGEAKLQVYPGPVPSGKDRVASGSFIPVTADTPN